MTIYEPESAPKGATFFVTGASTPPYLYDNSIHVILDQNQFVIAIFSNIFVPRIDNHRFKAS